jgi:putative transposase
LIVNRVERHLIKKSNSMWKIVDQKCFEAKNLYNVANYIVRQEFINNGNWIKANHLDKMLQNTNEYKILGSQASQRSLSLLEKNWKSYFVAIKDWSKKKGEGYFGKPKLPRYKDKNGRSILMIKNIQCKIKNGLLIFSWKPLREFSGIKTNVTGKLMQVRFIPSGNCYFMEIVYQAETSEVMSFNNRIIGIDLGVNNFATIVNNIGKQPIVIKGGIIKSMNQYYNKKRVEISKQTKMIWNNRMRNLTDKHLRKIDTYMHTVSKRILQYCVENNVDTLIVGRTKEWKNSVNLGHVNNQNFVCIPYEKFINQLKYKCENIGIDCVVTEENYTSATSFLDDELPIKENSNIKRRIKRGLFKTNNGTLINADVNGAYQIVKKVYPNAFAEMQARRGRGCDLHPVIFEI